MMGRQKKKLSEVEKAGWLPGRQESSKSRDDNQSQDMHR